MEQRTNPFRMFALLIFTMPMRQLTIFIVFVLIFALPKVTEAQDSVVVDSMTLKLQLLDQLYRTANYEQAQVEAELLREFLNTHNIPLSAKSVTLISSIYKANRDERSATRLLTEAELDARHDPNTATKAALLTVLVQECRAWQLPDQALTCQQLLSVTRDSMIARERRKENLDMQQKYDSLTTLRAQEIALQSQNIVLKQENALVVGAVVFGIFLILIVSRYRNNNKWASFLKKKELEWEITRANIHQEAEETAAQQVLAVSQNIQVNTANDTPHYPTFHGPKPNQIALLIEPNRQVVLYLKSLLSDRFQIETASTSIEGLQMASDLLPDLVVCDTVLNGNSGIEVARQIKLSERTNHVPVVLLTDKYGNEGKLDALRAGANAWFTRPVIDDEFDATVQRLLEARKVQHNEFRAYIQLYFSDNKIQIQDPFLLQTVEMIEHNLANPDYMADEIARKLQLTKTHFTKKLLVLTGKEPVQLIRELRLEKAKTLLEKRAGTPNAISEMVGFSNPGSFALAFKEYFGENTLLLYSLPPNRLV
jgi:CheY-like chemotaxis protein